MDEADAYLSLAVKTKRRHFTRGHITASSGGEQNHVSEVVNTVVIQPTVDNPNSVRPRLPPKKRKARNDSSDEDENRLTEKGSSTSAAGPSVQNATEAGNEIVSNSQPGPLEIKKSTLFHSPTISLVEKYFPGTTLQQGTLATSQAPSVSVVESTMERFQRARERLVSMRMSIEVLMEEFISVLEETNPGEQPDNGSDDSEQQSKRVDQALTEYLSKVDWNEKCELLSSSFGATEGNRTDTLRTMCRILLHSPVCLANDSFWHPVPRTSSPRAWYEYVERVGPHTGVVPPQSLFLFLDSSCMTALFCVVVEKLLRGGRGKDTVTQSNNLTGTGMLYINEEDDTEKVKESDEEAEEEEEQQQQEPPQQPWERYTTHIINDVPSSFASSVLHNQRQLELLRFLRYFMPISIENAEGTHHTVGYGPWLYCCLMALEVPLDPETQRVAHGLFRTCCNHIRTIGEWIGGLHGNTRGALQTALLSREEGTVSDKRPRAPKTYWSMDEIGKSDLLGLYTVIIVLAKVFQQNQNNLIPL